MKVLLALDGSAPSLLARDLVAGLPWPAETAIHLVAAYQVPTDWTGGVNSTTYWAPIDEDALRTELDDELQTLGMPLQNGRDVVRHVIRGRAADVINDLAAEIGADLIVTGSRGRGRVESMLLGSVATEVATGAPCPILVARGASVSRLLVATDGSDGVSAIPERLGAWGVFRGNHADTIAVWVPDGPAFELMVDLYTLGKERFAALQAESAEKARADAESMAQRLTSIGIPATAQVRKGDRAHEILAAAKDLSSDLIVTGSRGLGAVDRLLLGSVARNVVTHALCSVLVVRGGPAPGHPAAMA